MRPHLRTRHKRDYGALRSDQIASALRKCFDSAYDLYESGNQLNHTGPRTTATGLIVLALEEYGKIGWLYLGLMLREDDKRGWAMFWDGYHSHRLKAEVAHEMNVMRGNLLPFCARFLRHDMFSFSSTSGVLDRQKQAVLYVGYDREKGEFTGPRDFPIDNGGLVDVVENLVMYAAGNERAHVFDPRVVAEFRGLNVMAGDDERLRGQLLLLFYDAVLRTRPGLAGSPDMAEAEAEVRTAAKEEASTMLARWRDLGEVLLAS